MMSIFKWAWLIFVSSIAVTLVGSVQSFEASEYKEVAGLLGPLECFALGSFLSTKGGSLDPVAASAEMTKSGGNYDGFQCESALLIWKNDILPSALKNLNKSDENFERDTFFRGLKLIRRWDLVEFLDKSQTTTHSETEATHTEQDDQELEDVNEEEGNSVEGEGEADYVFGTPTPPETEFDETSTEDDLILIVIPHKVDIPDAVPANEITEAPDSIPDNGGVKKDSTNKNPGNFKIRPKFGFVLILIVILIGITALVILVIIAGFLFSCLRKRRIEDEEFDLEAHVSNPLRPISPNYSLKNNRDHDQGPNKLASNTRLLQGDEVGTSDNHNANTKVNNNLNTLVVA